jgi:hypothetical protein
MTDIREELRRATLRRLQREWSGYNSWHLGGKLRPPAFEIADDARRLGSWHRGTRTIAFSRGHLEGATWSEVIDTLKHEMAHQYVDEVLGLEEALPHGEAFRRACRLLAIDPAARAGAAGESGAGGGAAGGPEPEAAARLRKIRGLLALAESSNAHEAEAALAKANELLLKYNIDVAAAETERRYVVRELGRPTGRRNRHDMILAGLIAEHFFVEAIWIDTFDVRTGRSGQVLEVCGTPENVELAEYAHHELLRSAEELWRRHRLERGIGGDRDRRPFVEGVVTGYSERLRAEKERREQRHELVWLGDPKLDQFFRARHPRVRQQRYYVSAGTEAFSAGKEAGASLELTPAVKGRARGEPRLLTG